MKVVLENLTKKFQNRNRKDKRDVIAVDSFNLEIPDGKLVGLLGPSGCGKSTMLYMISGLLTPTEGKIYFGENDVTKVPTENRGVGLVFQNYALYPHLTVKQNIIFPLQNLKGKDKLTKEEMDKRAYNAAKIVQIDEFLDRKPNALSGGQQQRLCIARALAVKPEVILMDEPTSALDPISTSKIEDLVMELKKQYTIVMVTHNMQQATRVADETVFFLLGEIIEHNNTEAMFSMPKDKRTEDYISGRFG